MNQFLERATPTAARFDKTASKPKTIRVAIVDDDDTSHAEVATQIAADPSYRVVRTCPDGESALNDLPRFNPEVVLLELNLPGMDGVECIRRLKALAPQMHIIILTACQNRDRLMDALIAGANGCLPKCTTPERLRAAIREASEGGAPMPPDMASCVLQRLRQNSVAPPDRVNLTPREQEILDQLSQGFRYKEIVANLGISFGTLHSYISKVYEKLQVHSRTEAVVKYLNLY